VGAVTTHPAAPAVGGTTGADDACVAGRAPLITRHLLEQTGFKADEADSGAVTLIQRFGSAANLNIHLHRLVLDGVYRRTNGEPVFDQADFPTDEELQALLHRIIARLKRVSGDEADDGTCVSGHRRCGDGHQPG